MFLQSDGFSQGTPCFQAGLHEKKKKTLFCFSLGNEPWSTQGMYPESVGPNFLEPTHTCPSSWDPSFQSYSKTIPDAAGSIFSCIIYLNTCLTILDSARSWKGGATGPPTDSFPIRLHLLVCIHPAAKKGLPLPQVWFCSYHTPGG